MRVSWVHACGAELADVGWVGHAGSKENLAPVHLRMLTGEPVEGPGSPSVLPSASAVGVGRWAVGLKGSAGEAVTTTLYVPRLEDLGS